MPEVQDEREPWMGWIRVGRPHSTPGRVLFDSDVRHGEYVVLEIGQAVRRREYGRDWITEASGGEITEIAMSMAQWGAFVSSFGSSGVPCTIDRVGRARVKQPTDVDSRLTLSAQECRDAAKKETEKVASAIKTLREAAATGRKKEITTALNRLDSIIGNLPENLEFAAQSLSEHVETVVTKAKADIEAHVERHAAHLGIIGDDKRAIMASLHTPELGSP